jgi:hypothetical protein
MESLKAVWNWLSVNWGFVCLVVIPIVAKILNKITANYSDRKGLVRFCLMVIDILDVIKLTPPPAKTGMASGTILGTGFTPTTGEAKDAAVAEAVVAIDKAGTAIKKDKDSSTGAPSTPTPPVGMVLAFVLLSLAFSACGTVEKQLIRAAGVTLSLRQELKDEMNDECLGISKKCKEAGKTKVDDCKELTSCWDKRALVYKTTTSIQLAIKTGLGFVTLGQEESAKAIVMKVTASLLQLYSDLQKYKVIQLSGK